MVNFTTKEKEHWQLDSLQWAKAKEAFTIHDVKARHLTFCNELAAAYKSTCRYSPEERVIVLEPFLGSD
jgi:hypothetical protein